MDVKLCLSCKEKKNGHSAIKDLKIRERIDERMKKTAQR
jgi:hypothetical protein